jgi:UDP-3-O-[3-hydroxymyristoyl] glucosamine N-acyltransferase
MNIHELAEGGEIRDLNGARLTPQMVQDLIGNSVSRDAVFHGWLQIGHNTHIQEVTVGSQCVIEDEVTLGSGVHVGQDVSLAHGVEVGENSIIARGSRVGQHAVLEAGVIVGRDVSIPQEAQIGRGMIIPSTETILALGRLGSSKRMMTVHGSDTGPRYSAGC